jgi:hypothetical protein
MRSKPKGFNKKLTLSKETIANLSGAEQKEVLGGYAKTWYFLCAEISVRNCTLPEYSCDTGCTSCPLTDCCAPTYDCY